MKLTQARRTYAARHAAAMAHFKPRPRDCGSNMVPAVEFCKVTIQWGRFAPPHRWPASCPHFTPLRRAQQCVESYHGPHIGTRLVRPHHPCGAADTADALRTLIAKQRFTPRCGQRRCCASLPGLLE